MTANANYEITPQASPHKALDSTRCATAFGAALLLTGNIEQAEVAVLEAIRCVKGEAPVDEVLLDNVVKVAVDPRRIELERSMETLDSSAPLLPAELRAVMRLPSTLRRCFVLRILLKMSGASCAQLLDLHPNQVDHNTREAMMSLPALADPARSFAVADGGMGNL